MLSNVPQFLIVFVGVKFFNDEYQRDIREGPHGAHAPPSFKTISIFLVVRSYLKKLKVIIFTSGVKVTA